MTFDPFSQKAEDDFLAGPATAAKWPKVGYVVEGTVLSFKLAQCSDYDTSELLFWEGDKKVIESKAEDKRRPVMQMLMEVQGKPTGETWSGLQNVREEVPNDDGVRTMYIKAGLQAAMRNALRTAGARVPETGAYVRVERIADKPSTDKRYAPAHQFKAEWTPASRNLRKAEEFLNEGGSAPADEDPFA